MMTANEMEQALIIQETYSDQLDEQENTFIEVILFEDRLLEGDDKIKFIDLIERTIGYGREM